MSDIGEQPEMMEIIREVPYIGGEQNMGLVDETYKVKEERVGGDSETVKVVAQQPQGVLGLVDYDSDESD